MTCTIHGETRLAYAVCEHVVDGRQVERYKKPTEGNLLGDASGCGQILCSECVALIKSEGWAAAPWHLICEPCGESIMASRQ